ncbi:MAG: hypothetical protein RLZZ181_1008 [Pseudomonadota bacterium]|jgi:hypothetical protein
MNKQQYKEFWIDNRFDKDVFIYNVKRGVCNFNFEGSIHVVEHSALHDAQNIIIKLKKEIDDLKYEIKEWEQYNKQR